MEKQFQLTKKTIKLLPEKLKSIRMAQGISQGKVAKKMGVLQSHTSMIENKDRNKIPMLITLIKYAEAVNCKLFIEIPEIGQS